MLQELLAVLFVAHGPAHHVVVRTKLVHGSGGFDWLDAAAGFGLAVVSAAAFLLVIEVARSHRSSIGSPSRRTNSPFPAGHPSDDRKDVHP